MGEMGGEICDENSVDSVLVGVLESGIGSFLIRISVLVRYQPNVRTRHT